MSWKCEENPAEGEIKGEQISAGI